MQGKFGAVQAHIQFVAQCAFLNEALFQAGDDLGVHAAMMVTSDLCNALTHAVRKTYDEFVSGAAGIDCLFHWAHKIDRV
ncbi:hypothetical protein D9M71_252910 [compost metagenome]